MPHEVDDDVTARVEAVAQAQEASRTQQAARVEGSARAWAVERARQAKQEAWSRYESSPERPELIGDEHDDAALLLKLWNDPHEGPVARPFLRGGPTTAAHQAAYRDFLLERGDLRGEVLALIMELAAEQQPPDAERKRARLAELKPQISSQWLRLLVAQAHVLNCGLGREHLPRVRFAFKCPRSWEELTPTEQPGVRHCGGCDEDVYHVETVVAAEELARQRKCIAVPVSIAEQGGYPGGRSPTVAGRPAHSVRKWAARLFEEAPE